MLKKFVFSVTAFSIAFMVACSDDSAGGSLAGGTIDPNSIAEASSSSQMSSSAVAPVIVPAVKPAYSVLISFKISFSIS